MARKGRTPLHNSSLPGMPGKRSLRRQALQIARSSVTPKSEITHQYQRAQTDTTGFTQALIGLLQGQQGAYTSAANDALSQQQGIDTAAVSRLNGLGAGIAPAAQVATGALGDTAASRLVGQGEALKAYGAQQPGIAASRGALAHLGLTNAEQDALQQRRDQLHQAYMQAYPQVQQNAFNQSLAIQNLGLSRQQLAAQIAQNKAGLAQQGASLAEQRREFNVSSSQSEKHFWAQLSAQYGGQGKETKTQSLMKHYGYTATQWRAAVKDARTGAAQAVFHRVPPDVFLQKAIQENVIPPEIALNAVRVIYGGLKGADPKKNPGKWQVYQMYQEWLLRNRHDKTPPSQKAHRHR